jgi:hypothetical protein
MKYILLISCLLLSLNIHAQFPQKISYQAVIRDAKNNLLSLRDVGMRISVIQGENEGTAVYIETQKSKTNLNGLISLKIGTGDVIMGDFSMIDWPAGKFYIYTETDPDGGFDYRINGSSELLSVPFAMYSANSKNSFDTTSMSNRINKKINATDTANMLKGYLRSNDYAKTNSLIGVDSFNLFIKGNLGATGNVTVGGNIEALGKTSSLGTKEKPFKELFISSGSLSIASDTPGLNIPAAILSNVRGNLEISAGGFKLLGTNEAFIAPRIISTLTGNASTATKLETTRNINGINFDGTTDIIIPAETRNSLTFNNIGTGDVSGGTFDGSSARIISYNSLGAAPLSGSIFITTLGDITSGSIPFALISGVPTIWNQSTTGNAATVTTNANLNGVVTSIGNITNIGNNVITNSMLANSAVTNLSGTNTGDQVLPTLNSLGAVAINNVITGATKTKISYDTKGLVTAGSDATTADIAASPNKSYLTDIQTGVLSNTTGINTNDETTATIKTKLGITTLSGSNTGDQTEITGNASTASRLFAPIYINGITFDGSINITIASNAGTLTGTTLAPTVTFSSLKSIGTLVSGSIPYSLVTGTNELVKYDENRNLKIDGSIAMSTDIQNKNLPEQNNIIDLNLTIHKLTGLTRDNEAYSLIDGIEGNIIYFVPFYNSKFEIAGPDKIVIIIENCAYWDSNNKLISTRVKWQPFSEIDKNKTLATAIFTEQSWSVSCGIITPL